MNNIASTNKPCLCRAFALADANETRTGCRAYTETPGALFVRGHDAKLKALAIRAKRAGVDLVVSTVNCRVSGDPAEMISTYASSTLGAMVASASVTKTARTKTVKTATPVAGPAVGDVRSVKVGRWTYDGAITDIEGDMAEVTYTTRAGKTETVWVTL